MKSHTYYDILGVSRDATLDEITTAKNALAKVYHPDANAHKNIDTTAFMQEILEAYRVLSNPEKRRKYNQETFGETERVFKTFTLTPENEEENTGSFVTYWNMSNQLRTILNKSIRLMKQETQKKTLTQRVFQKWGKYQKEETIRNQQIAKLSTQAVQYITALKMAGIPMDYWSSDAMNWILVRWGQKQSVDYHTLFSRYDDYVEETLSNSERIPCVVIDPANSYKVVEVLNQNNLHCTHILLTHGHFDHMMALEQLRQATGAPVYIHEDDAELMTDDDLNAAKLLAGVSCSPRPADILLHDGDTVKIGGESVCVMHTPGHTRGSVCYFFGGDGDILTGDTLFRDSIGRYDLPGGDFMTLLHSLGALASLEGEHKIYPGHGATSTLEREKSVNLYLN